jgi:hypothetical protein
MADELNLELAGGYYFHTFKRIVRDLQPLLTLTEPAKVTIDMSRLTFMGPAALALTAATLNKVRTDLTLPGSVIVPPSAPGIYRYLTATPERNSGYGLAFTQFLLGLNGGRLLVRSGFGHVQRGARTVDKLEGEHLPGTVVGLRIKTDRPFDFTLAWNQLTDALNNVPSLLDQLRHADN